VVKLDGQSTVPLVCSGEVVFEFFYDDECFSLAAAYFLVSYIRACNEMKRLSSYDFDAKETTGTFSNFSETSTD
jgi:hypothetical protein